MAAETLRILADQAPTIGDYLRLIASLGCGIAFWTLVGSYAMYPRSYVKFREKPGDPLIKLIIRK